VYNDNSVIYPALRHRMGVRDVQGGRADGPASATPVTALLWGFRTVASADLCKN